MTAGSEAAWSTLSDTDQIMFKVLSNPDRIDLTDMMRDAPPPMQPPPSPPRIVEETAGGGDNEWNIERPHPEGLPRADAPPIDAGERALPSQPPPPPFDAGADALPSQPPPPAFDAGADAFPPQPPQPPPLPDADPSQPPPPPAERMAPPDQTLEDARDREMTKRTVLLDLQHLEQTQGVRLTKDWSMEDDVNDMMLELRRITLTMDEQANVNMMRDGMRLMLTGIEVVNNRFGLLDLEGWSSEVCRDLHKHDANLGRIYRRWWRRSSSTNPEVDICMSVLGSMGMHHLKRTMSKQMVSKVRPSRSTDPPRPQARMRPPPAVDDSSDDEEGVPPQ